MREHTPLYNPVSIVSTKACHLGNSSATYMIPYSGRVELNPF